MIKLEPMEMFHAGKMLEWKNYPETRQFALISHDEISFEDHVQWLEKNIQYFQVIMINGQLAGAIRIYEHEISIWVDRTFWGHGVATQVIIMASYPNLTAKIVPANIASLKAFLKAKYRLITYVKDPIPYYILKA